MFPPNNQKPLSTQVPVVPQNAGQRDSSFVARDEGQNGALGQAETVVYTSKRLQDDLQNLGLKIKKHELNIKFLKSQKNSLDDSILDMQVSLGKYHSSSLPMIEDEDHSEDETVERIIRHDKSAAGIFCTLKNRHGSQASHLPLIKDVLGIVATLGKVNDDNLSSLLSEYLGLETMLAIVCKTCDGVKALETYDKDGSIISNSGLHGLGASIGRHLVGRFLVICLENLGQYCGEFVADDPQRRLDIPKPRIPSGETPPGFLGYAVNMIDIDTGNLCYVTANGHGLRETLFFNLFSHLQVYRTRSEMILALPCIRNGAVSLDGGIMKTSAMFSLGKREDLDIKFPKSYMTSNLPATYSNTEKQMHGMRWRTEKLLEDMHREQALLDQAKSTFEKKKQEFVKFLAENSPFAAQYALAGRGTTLQ